MENVISQLKKFFDEKHISQREVADSIGIRPQYINAIFSGRRAIGHKIADKLSEQYNISKVWLLTGEGDMFSEENSTPIKLDADAGLPYYDVENFECGTPGGFGKALEKANPDGYFQFPWIKNDGFTWCVKAHGNSMVNVADPMHSIFPGSYIALRRSQVSAIQWGEVYALATADGYIIKKIMPSEMEGCVKCVSFNSDEFPAFDLPTSDIYDYALVVGVATINLW